MSTPRKLTQPQEREVALAYLCGVHTNVLKVHYDVSPTTVDNIVGKYSRQWHDDLVEWYRTNYSSKDKGRNAAHLLLYFDIPRGSTPVEPQLIERDRDQPVYQLVRDAIFDQGIEGILQKTALREYAEQRKGEQANPYDLFIQAVFGRHQKGRAYNIVHTELVRQLQDAYKNPDPIKLSVVYDNVGKEIIQSVKDGGLGWSQIKKDFVDNVLGEALNGQELDVIRMRYDLDWHEGEGSQTLDQIAAHFDVSRERIRQIESKGLRKIRSNKTSLSYDNVHPLALLQGLATDEDVKDYITIIQYRKDRQRWKEMLRDEYIAEMYPQVVEEVRDRIERGDTFSGEETYGGIHAGKRVDELEMSVRTANCLENAGIETIGQLCARSEADMLKIRNFGRKSLNELREILRERGLSFRT